VNQLVHNEKHVGLKNLHVVNAIPGTFYWTPFQFFGRADLPQAVRFYPSTAGGRQVGIIFAANTQRALKLSGFKQTKPTAAMLSALKQRLGPAADKYDTSALYMLADLAKGGMLEDLTLPIEGLQALLLFTALKTAARGGTLVIEQVEDRKEMIGGSQFVLHALKRA
jgi:hypothetical protein